MRMREVKNRRTPQLTSPHASATARRMGDDVKPKPPSSREAKLAQALRANLRRRKAPVPVSTPKPADDAQEGG
jgi:hypothetical protein